MDVRRRVFTKETITAVEMGMACARIIGVAAMAVVRNPVAVMHQDDLSLLFDVTETVLRAERNPQPLTLPP